MLTDLDEIMRAMRELDGTDPQKLLRDQRREILIDQPSKVIFLDFDGVLNSLEWLNRGRPSARYGLKKDSPEWLALTFDPVCMDRLNRIIAATGAVVIVSSSWRGTMTREKLQELLD